MKSNEEIVTALLSSPSIQDAAKVLKMNRSNLWKRLQDPELQDLLFKARRDLLMTALTELQIAMSEAVRVLRDIMADVEAAPAVRVSAARTVLDMAFKGHAAIEIEQRLSEIERNLGIE
jgi:hypothetical protein